LATNREIRTWRPASREVDLRGQVGARVDLFPHVERGGLGIAEVFGGVGSRTRPSRDPLGIVRAGPDLLAFLGHHGGGAGVLAHWQDALGGDLGVFQQRERDVAVVGRRLRSSRIAATCCRCFVRSRNEHVVKRLPREVGERFEAPPSGSRDPRMSVVLTPSRESRRYSVSSGPSGSGSW
jgi:hypothetical protein